MTEAGGETASDYESDPDEIDNTQSEDTRFSKSKGTTKEGDMVGEYAFRRDRIFKYITVQDKMVRVPDLRAGEEHKLTLFMELDDVLLHSFICDENFGYIANPASKDPEHEIFLPEINQPCLIYMRDHYDDFLQYLRDNSDIIDPIVYTSAMSPYTDKLLNILDPNREIFKTVLYQNACYIF